MWTPPFLSTMLRLKPQLNTINTFVYNFQSIILLYMYVVCICVCAPRPYVLSYTNRFIDSKCGSSTKEDDYFNNINNHDISQPLMYPSWLECIQGGEVLPIGDTLFLQIVHMAIEISLVLQSFGNEIVGGTPFCVHLLSTRRMIVVVSA